MPAPTHARNQAARPGRERANHPCATAVRASRIVIAVAILMQVALAQAILPLARASDEQTAKSTETETSAALAIPSPFVGESRQRLRKLENDLLYLGARSLVRTEVPGAPAERSEDRALNQMIKVKSAQANYENAKLTREIAEIGVIEYEEGLFKQDEATAKGELILAESDLNRSKNMLEIDKDRLAQIKKLSSGSGYDLYTEFTYEDRVASAERRESVARIAIEKAQAKLDILIKYTKPRRIKELRAAVENARADELAKQGEWEHEKFELAKSQELAKNAPKGIESDPVQPLLNQAISSVEAIKKKIALAAQAQEPAEPLRHEVTALLAKLEAFIEQAREAETAARWAALKTRLKAAAMRVHETKAK